MTIESRILAGFSAVAVADRALRAVITGTATGDLSGLTTTTKASIIAAINELEAAIQAIDIHAVIDDTKPLATNTTYSASHIEDRLIAIRDGILGGASTAYDTLLELQQFLQSDDSQLAALLTAVNNKVDFAAAQSLTTGQQQQARDNIGAASQASLTTTNSNVTALAGRVTANEGAITTIQGKITAVENTDFASAYNTALTA